MATRYTKDHEWISLDGATATIGITTYAQEQLGDIVFVELPQIGKSLTKGGEAAVVESVKAASDVYAPVSGDVVEVNTSLDATPATVNEDAEGNGWFMKIRVKDPAELDGLMSSDEYQSFLKTLS
jgi:glycine cleavage system H protein